LGKNSATVEFSLAAVNSLFDNFSVKLNLRYLRAMMEAQEFLEKHVFTDLKNQNDGFDDESIYYFSQEDFAELLYRVEHFGIGVYEIKARQDDKFLPSVKHLDLAKKATNPDWYKKAFLTLSMKHEGLLYAASYKISKKLLAREKLMPFDSEEE
jgi:hypothetical protein